jgi:hypothetical protein
MLENTTKQKIFFLILGIIFFLYGSFITLDWTLFFFDIAPVAQPEIPYTRIAKVSSAFLCATLAWITGIDGFNKSDTKKIQIVFISIAVGEVIFLLDIYIMGVIIFALTQILLIWRNGQGFRNYNQTETLKNRLRWGILLAAIISLITVLIFILIIYPNLVGSDLLIVIMIYAILVSISLWTGWMTFRIGFFPKKNVLMISIGMTCFFIADFLVGLNISLEPGTLRIITHYLTWIFYEPALLLLSLSGYQWKEK